MVTAFVHLFICSFSKYTNNGLVCANPCTWHQEHSDKWAILTALCKGWDRWHKEGIARLRSPVISGKQRVLGTSEGTPTLHQPLREDAAGKELPGQRAPGKTMHILQLMNYKDESLSWLEEEPAWGYGPFVSLCSALSWQPRKREILIQEFCGPRREFRKVCQLGWEKHGFFFFIHLQLKFGVPSSYECSQQSACDVVTKRSHVLSHHFIGILKCRGHSSLLWNEGCF